MSQATYRGCQYNTDTPKQEYQHWYSETHAPAAPPLKYRGQSIVHVTTGIGRKQNELVELNPQTNSKKKREFKKHNFILLHLDNTWGHEPPFFYRY